MLGMERLQAGARHVGVDLGGREIAVAEQQLHHAKIGTVVDQVGGEGVAQGVGGEVFVDTGSQRVLLDPVPEGLAGHAATPPRGEEGVAGPALEQFLARAAQKIDQPALRLVAQRHQPLLAPLAGDPHHALGEADLVLPQVHQFGNPQARGIEQFQHHPVTEPLGTFQLRRLQQRLHLGFGEALGQWPPEPGKGHFQGGILFHPSLAQRVLEELAQGGKAPGPGSGTASQLHQGGQVGEQLLPAGLAQGGALVLLQPACSMAQVRLVSRQRVARQPPLHPQGIGEMLDIPGITHVPGASA